MLNDDEFERKITLSIRGRVWQPDGTTDDSVKEISHPVGYPDLRKLTKDYETRYGKCAAFTIEIVK